MSFFFSYAMRDIAAYNAMHTKHDTRRSIHVPTCAYMCIYIYTSVYIYMCICVYIYIYVYMYICMRMLIWLQCHICTHIYIYVYIYTGSIYSTLAFMINADACYVYLCTCLAKEASSVFVCTKATQVKWVVCGCRLCIFPLDIDAPAWISTVEDKL